MNSRFRDNALIPGAGSGTHVDPRGNYIQTLDPGLVNVELLKEKYGVQPLLLSWHATRQFLAEFLPPDIVQFNSQVSSRSLATSCPVCNATACAQAHSTLYLLNAALYFANIADNNNSSCILSSCLSNILDVTRATAVVYGLTSAQRATT